MNTKQHQRLAIHYHNRYREMANVIKATPHMARYKIEDCASVFQKYLEHGYEGGAEERENQRQLSARYAARERLAQYDQIFGDE